MRAIPLPVAPTCCRLPSIRKTIRWKSTTTRSPGSASAISKPGLGASATLSFADAEAIRGLEGVQYVACGVHGNARVHFGEKRWFTRMHGTDLHLLDIKRTWTLRSGRFFTEDEQEKKADVMVLGSVVAEKVFGLGVDPVGQGPHALEPELHDRGRGDERELGRAACARRRRVRRGVHAVHDHSQAAEPHEAERHHGDVGLDG